jgi:hypothetical protein
MSLPKELILKRGDTILATMTACRPADEMFWLACEFSPTEAGADVVALIDEASDVPHTEEGFARSREIIEALYNSDLRLIDPVKQVYLQYWGMFTHPDGTVTIRWAGEIPLE